MQHHEQLADLMDEYLLAEERGDRAALSRLVAAHPAYEHQLTAFALVDAAVPTIPAPAKLAQAEQRLSPALRSRALAAIFGHPVESPALQPIVGILAQAEAVGLSARALATAVDLPRDVVLQLDKRLIAVGSMPRRLLHRLAETLQTSADSLNAFLAGGPSTRVAAFNFADRAPQVEEQGSFAEAIRESQLSTPEQQARWESILVEDGLADRP